jgi:hypothetical protein
MTAPRITIPDWANVHDAIGLCIIRGRKTRMTMGRLDEFIEEVVDAVDNHSVSRAWSVMDRWFDLRSKDGEPLRLAAALRESLWPNGASRESASERAPWSGHGTIPPRKARIEHFRAARGRLVRC